MYLIKRKPTTSREELVAHWFANHMPAVIQSQQDAAERGRMHASRYLATLFQPGPQGDHPWDGVAQLWVDSPAAYQAMLDSPEFQNESWPDGGTFLDLDLAVSFVAQEYQIKWG